MPRKGNYLSQILHRSVSRPGFCSMLTCFYDARLGFEKGRKLRLFQSIQMCLQRLCEEAHQSSFQYVSPANDAPTPHLPNRSAKVVLASAAMFVCGIGQPALCPQGLQEHQSGGVFQGGYAPILSSAKLRCRPNHFRPSPARSGTLPAMGLPERHRPQPLRAPFCRSAQP